MYSYSYLAHGEGACPPLQPLTYTYLSGPLLLPPIQAHNFYSRPPVLSAGDWTAPREYHCFHGPGASPWAAPFWWAFPQAYAAALRPPFPAPGYPGLSMQAPPAAPSSAQWPEGSSLQAELRWGRVERVLGPGLELPDLVLRELRRVYGTYPRTDVRVTFRGGEFLVQGEPRVTKPEYRVHKSLQRLPNSSGSGDSSPAGEVVERGRQKKRKGLG